MPTIESNSIRQKGISSSLEQIKNSLLQLKFSIKKEDIWKLLFMERKRISIGKSAYEEEEPGYISSMIKGYLFMLQSMEKKFNSVLYEQLHDECIRNVTTQQEPDGIPLGFRKYTDGGEAFDLKLGETVSKEGVKELLNRRITYRYTDEIGDSIFPLKTTLANHSTIFKDLYMKLKPTHPQTCKANTDFAISLYEKADKSTEEKTLLAIVRLCQDLDQFHVFVDGNIRTIGILVLNRLLIQNQLTPAVLSDVNAFDCLSEKELISCICEGQRFFLGLLEK